MRLSRCALPQCAIAMSLRSESARPLVASPVLERGAQNLRMAHETIGSASVDMASVHRPGSIGIDLPAGASADTLAATDYRTVELEEVGVGELFVDLAEVHRTGDVGLDLPAGASGDDLKPEDYHPVEVEDEPVASA